MKNKASSFVALAWRDAWRPGNPVHVGSVESLAAALGVDRYAVKLWQKHPRCPGREACGCFNVDRWRSFAATLRRQRPRHARAVHRCEVHGNLVPKPRAKPKQKAPAPARSIIAKAWRDAWKLPDRKEEATSPDRQ